jgi:hypothetical protein
VCSGKVDGEWSLPAGTNPQRDWVLLKRRQAASVSCSALACVVRVVRPPSRREVGFSCVGLLLEGGAKLPAIIKAGEIRDRDCVEIKARTDEKRARMKYRESAGQADGLFVCKHNIAAAANRLPAGLT